MSTSNTQGRKGREQEIRNRRGVQLEKASSFNGRSIVPPAPTNLLRRLRTVPDLATGKGILDKMSSVVAEEQQKPRLTRLLLNVTLDGSVGSLQVVMRPEATVGDLLTVAVKDYVKEGRRPYLRTVDPSCYDLHYSQFSLESLSREEKLMELGSRNFFICPKKSATTRGAVDENDDESGVASSSSTCSRQVNLVAAGSCFEWLKLINLFTLINFSLLYSYS